MTDILETTPELVDGFESQSDSNNIFLRLANGNSTVDFREHGLRRGTFDLVYGDDEDGSREAELMLANGTIFLLDAPERLSIEMVFVVAGRIHRHLDRDTRRVWLVSVEYEEIDA